MQVSHIFKQNRYGAQIKEFAVKATILNRQSLFKHQNKNMSILQE